MVPYLSNTELLYCYICLLQDGNPGTRFFARVKPRTYIQRKTGNVLWRFQRGAGLRPRRRLGFGKQTGAKRGLPDPRYGLSAAPDIHPKCALLVPLCRLVARPQLELPSVHAARGARPRHAIADERRPFLEPLPLLVPRDGIFAGDRAHYHMWSGQTCIHRIAVLWPAFIACLRGLFYNRKVGAGC